MNNYLPDNNHLHHLIYKYFKKLNFIKKNFLLSSFVGLSINSVLIMNYSIGYFFISNTILQVILILTNVLIYMTVYYLLRKKLKEF